MHNRKVFVYKDVNYGSSKTSTTQNTALNPSDLRDGAVGVYGIHRAGSTNLNKLVLITDGGSEVAGAVPMASFVGSEVVIAMGTTDNVQLSGPIQRTPLPSGLKRSVGQVYTAPVLGVNRIGYNGTAGTSFAFPSTVLRGDDFIISIVDRNSIVSGFRDPFNKVTISVAADNNGDTPLILATKWIAAANLRSNIMIDKTKIKLLHNGTGAVFANSATVAAVNGATTLTTSAAHSVTAGDAISLAGDYYVTTTGTAASTLVLTRAYQGPTATIANADTLDITGAATVFGLELVDDIVGRNLTFARDGLITNASYKQQTAPLSGAGTQAQIAALEAEALPKKGTHDMLITYVDKDIIRASTTYDQYILTIQNSNHPTGQQGSVFNVIGYLTLAFVSGVADTTNFNQSDFEDIMISLFGTTFPAIS
jgi:hypothetical protein